MTDDESFEVAELREPTSYRRSRPFRTAWQLPIRSSILDCAIWTLVRSKRLCDWK